MNAVLCLELLTAEKFPDILAFPVAWLCELGPADRIRRRHGLLDFLGRSVKWIPTSHIAGRMCSNSITVCEEFGGLFWK